MAKNNNERSNLVLYLISLASSIFLFLFVSYDNSQTIYSNNDNAGASIIAEETISNVPIEININQEQYYVTGVPESATLHLRGPQPVILQAMSASRLTVTTEDLNELGPGTHEVPLIFETNSRKLDYWIEPETITITIEERVVEEKEVNVKVDEEIFADGYLAGVPELSQSTVMVSGPRSEVDQIAEAVVYVNNLNNVTKDIDQSFTVVLLDAAGEIIDAQAEPAEIQVHIPVTQAENEKQVPVNLNLIGDDSSQYSYNITFADEADSTVTVAGAQEDISEVDQVQADVDVSGITEDTHLTVSLTNPEDVKLSKNQITVTVSVLPNEAGNSVESAPNSPPESSNRQEGNPAAPTNTPEEESSETSTETETETETETQEAAS